MAAYQYSAVSPGGKTSNGIIEADSVSDAIKILRSKDLYPMEVERISDRRKRTEALWWHKLGKFLYHRVSQKTVAGTVRQLAILLEAGMPLDSALGAMLEGRGGTEMDKILSQIKECIREGKTFAVALGEHPHVFPQAFISMIEAGESSGSLELVMNRMAEHMEEQLLLRRKIQSTLAYPILMMIVGASVLFFLMTFIIPKVTKIFIDLKHALPLPTRILIGTSDFFRNWWWLLLLAIVLFVIAVIKFSKTKKGKAVLDNLKMKMPLLGQMNKLMGASRFTRTVGMLIKNGVTLPTALKIAKTVSGNVLWENIVDEISSDVQEGKEFTLALRKSSLLNPTHVQLIMAGEKSGRLEQMLLVVAGDCENEIENRLQTLTSLMEPLMILLLGVVVGFVVVAILMPIFQMSSLIS